MDPVAIPDHKAMHPVSVSTPCCRLLLKTQPPPEDGLIDHLLRCGYTCLNKKEYAYAANIFESALELETQNRWRYHGPAAYHLAQLRAKDGRPDMGLLERCLRINPALPDALGLCIEHDRPLARRIVEETTGLGGIDIDTFHALMRSGNWIALNPFRHHDDTFRGKTVLDIGARTGFHGLSFLAAGAKLYAAMDPYPKSFIQTNVKNYLDVNHRRVELGVNMKQVAEQYPDRFKLTCFEGEYQDDNKYDFITLFVVSEHIMKLGQLFQDLRQWLKPDGRILVSHHNFYCWNGHHNVPKSKNQLEEMAARGEDLKRADWRFFKMAPKKTSLNKLPIRKVLRKMQKHFDLIHYEAVYTSYGKGIERFSPAILRTVQKEKPGLEPEDLLTQLFHAELRHKRNLLDRIRRIGKTTNGH